LGHYNFNMKNSSSSHEDMARQPKAFMRRDKTSSASNHSMEDGLHQFRTGSFSSNQSGAESDTEIIRKPGEREH